MPQTIYLHFSAVHCGYGASLLMLCWSEGIGSSSSRRAGLAPLPLAAALLSWLLELGSLVVVVLLGMRWSMGLSRPCHSFPRAERRPAP